MEEGADVLVGERRPLTKKESDARDKAEEICHEA